MKISFCFYSFQVNSIRCPCKLILSEEMCCFTVSLQICIQVEIIILNYLIGYKDLLVQFHSEKLSVILLCFEIYWNIFLVALLLEEKLRFNRRVSVKVIRQRLLCEPANRRGTDLVTEVSQCTFSFEKTIWISK